MPLGPTTKKHLKRLSVRVVRVVGTMMASLLLFLLQEFQIAPHNLVEVKYTAHTQSPKRTLAIIEKVPKTATTSIQGHVLNTPGLRVCIRDVNGFMNETRVGDMKSYTVCPCDTDILISHLTRFPSFVEHFLGHCRLENIDLLSVIPLRDDRINSELHYGHPYLGLDPEKSILENKYSYKSDPYTEYSRNIFKNRTCLFSFVSGTLKIRHLNPTTKHFDCSSEACRKSVAHIKRQEQIQLLKLREDIPICNQTELLRWLKMDVVLLGP